MISFCFFCNNLTHTELVLVPYNIFFKVVLHVLELRQPLDARFLAEKRQKRALVRPLLSLFGQYVVLQGPAFRRLKANFGHDISFWSFNDFESYNLHRDSNSKRKRET